MSDHDPATPAPAPLAGVRVLSLALNLPGPAALMRCRQQGADCVKLEPPTGDPMRRYNRAAYADLHEGVQVLQANLKQDDGQALLQQQLARADILLSSFRPSAMDRLGLAWPALHARHPRLSLVAIVGARGAQAEAPGHDLTYLAQAGLLNGTALPSTLFADMGGALAASEAVAHALLLRQAGGAGVRIEVALNEAAHWLARPRAWGLTQAGGMVGGAHAGYRIYACADGRVAVAALEPHFAAALCKVAQIAPADMLAPAVHAALAGWFLLQRREQLDALARAFDLPLYTLEGV